MPASEEVQPEWNLPLLFQYGRQIFLEPYPTLYMNERHHFLCSHSGTMRKVILLKKVTHTAEENCRETELDPVVCWSLQPALES